ncbi:unnamed protein product [Schistocephalus solidus]|uniref:Uncharacterized protein n=1 Tax=Schistocephalus solidus TaxID=70667 RepID=A0A183S7R2_SCHSO|nr:unnamed protein product [Schistocephalus solidus]
MIRKAEEIQRYADLNEMKNFFKAIKAIYGPCFKVTASLLSSDGTTLLTKKSQILKRWAEHFRSVPYCSSAISDAAIDRLPQVDTNNDLDLPPSLPNTIRAVQQISSGKAPGFDTIPSEVYKPQLLAELTTLFQEMWRQGQVPQDFKDATIVHFYNRKGNRQLCDNHRSISNDGACFTPEVDKGPAHSKSEIGLTFKEVKSSELEPLNLPTIDEMDKTFQSTSPDSACRSEHSFRDLPDNVNGETQEFGEQADREPIIEAADVTAEKEEGDVDDDAGGDIRSCELSNESDLDLSTIDEGTDDAEHSGHSQASYISPLSTKKSTPRPCFLKDASAANDGVQTQPTASRISTSSTEPESVHLSSKHRLFVAPSPELAMTVRPSEPSTPLRQPCSPSQKTPRVPVPRGPSVGTDSPARPEIPAVRILSAEGDNAPMLAVAPAPPATASPPTVKHKQRPLTSRKKAASGDGVPKNHPALISSLFPNVPPCVRFFDEHEKVESLPWEFRRLLHYRPSLMTPIIVRQVLSRSAFRASKRRFAGSLSVAPGRGRDRHRRGCQRQHLLLPPPPPPPPPPLRLSLSEPRYLCIV